MCYPHPTLNTEQVHGIKTRFVEIAQKVPKLQGRILEAGY